MENADVARIINSDEIQTVLRPKLEKRKGVALKKNPLKNHMGSKEFYQNLTKAFEAKKKVEEEVEEEE